MDNWSGELDNYLGVIKCEFFHKFLNLLKKKSIKEKSNNNYDILCNLNNYYIFKIKMENILKDFYPF